MDWFESPINGHWYGVDHTIGTWSYSESRANSLGGHLATIRNQGEQDWLESSIQAYLLGNGAWIGLTDVAVEGDFEWSSGDLSTYRNWFGGGPNNFGNNEHFVHLTGPTWGPTWLWNDAPDANGPIRPLIELTTKPNTGWSWPQVISTGGRPGWGCLADIDDDGDLDYISPDSEECCAGSNPDSISIHLNDGNGVFLPGPTLSVEAEPRLIAALDHDQNGTVDLVYTCESGQTLGLINNLGNGAFSSPSAIDTGHTFHGLTSADVNADGIEDLLVSTIVGTNDVLLYPGQAGGGFGVPASISAPGGSSPLFITPGDVDLDGDLDLAVAYRLSSQVAIYLNDGLGAFPTRFDLATNAGPFRSEISDLNGDNHPDIIVPAGDGDVLETWLGDGAGGFQLHGTFPAGDGPHFCVAADLNADGLDEFVVPSYLSDDVRVFESDGTGGLIPTELFSGHDYALTAAIGDLNNDGSEDLLVPRSFADSFAVWLNRQDGDCNLNGIPDDEDLAAGTSLDCNTNGIPDECEIASGGELDCNANGIPDSCDIAAGLEFDCNLNGIPDTCDLLAGTSADCDANGIPDECDLAAGAEDCNADGIPDACQIAADSTLDLNTNGTLDACEAIGTTYCAPAVANSTGLPGAVTILGNETV
ncbi:FG-GAP-like repeat-containing protein, partial [Planctomycetota bacterium]|nr:FG-GAP-like repeat-containing protein [Planctomycetota bacterium]